jgi:DNA-binding NtrC family response regulator
VSAVLQSDRQKVSQIPRPVDAAADYSRGRENFRTLHVLVVEDEMLIRWAIVETLTGAGHRVTEAADAASAVQALALVTPDDPIDAVLLDFRLPDSNDLALLASIRRQSPSSAVVLMSAFGTPEVARGALELGASRVIAKPFEMPDLEPLILDACASRRS